MTEIISIAMAADDRYARYAGAAAASALKHAESGQTLNFYILDSGISTQRKREIESLRDLHPGTRFEFLPVRAEEILPQAFLPEYISRTSMARLELPQRLPETEEIIYLDCDTIVMDSLAELWHFRLTEADVIAGAPDFGRTLPEHCRELGLTAERYINAGVLKMNLRKMREMDSSARFAESLEKHAARITMGDQDIINLAFSGHIARLPQRWNIHKAIFKFLDRQTLKEATAHPGILHFTGARKPWHYGAIRHPFRREYFKAVSGTVFAEPCKDWLNRFILLADRKAYKI